MKLNMFDQEETRILLTSALMFQIFLEKSYFLEGRF